MSASEGAGVRPAESYTDGLLTGRRLAPAMDLDGLVQVASLVCAAPMAMISMPGEGWQVSCARIDPKNSHSSAGAAAFCTFAAQQDDLVEVSDAALDPRFADDPTLAAPLQTRFLAGAPVIMAEGSHVGGFASGTPSRASLTTAGARS